METALTNPHDSFFKDLFTRQEAAHDFLKHYLPPDVAAALDPTRLEIRKDSFIDPDLQAHFSDILYRVGLVQGNAAYVYVLFEHKSYPEPRIAWQLLRYMARIWEQADKQGEPLLPVLPLVVYHGRQRWQVARRFSALFDLPGELRPYLPEFEYHLADLSQYSQADIKDRVERAVILQLGLLSLKYIYAEDVGEQLEKIIRLALALLEQRTGLEYINTILRYMVAGSDKLSEEQLRTIVLRVIEEGDELMPTIAEQWIEQGQAIGLEKGREEGREAALNILRRFLAQRFGVGLDHFDEAFRGFDLAALTHLSEAAFVSGTLAEFEAALERLKATSGGSEQPGVDPPPFGE
ncbi:MAG: Rpn family recombination-promoting nuclease/putative transposase [Anaerolineales bacterium]|nr:Rpn family recombination-promoting nuclease/putative transposase [Anaerolineales bacterium]